ncbi:MAG: hypothetical protein KF771_05760 [Burkholderiales bacterium]|nr:hypothetical protein [Burkholderiales bacterium]
MAEKKKQRATSRPNSTTQDFDIKIKKWSARYRETGRPVKVDFRSQVGWLRNGDRATHLIHPYPAKLLPHIAIFFLSSAELSQPGDTVLDSFGGTGTVALEAILNGRNAILFDANPLARLIARIKTTPISPRLLRVGLARIKARYKEADNFLIRDVVNINYWFYPHVIKKLSRLAAAIQAERNKSVREFFLIALANCARKVSLADPHLSVPVRVNPKKYKLGTKERRQAQDYLSRLKRVRVAQKFFEISDLNIKRMEEMSALLSNTSRAIVAGSDARNLFCDQTTGKRVRSNSVRLVITSPPYVGAQKYIRSSYLGLGWAGLALADELRTLEENSIGREHYPVKSYAKFSPTGVKGADYRLRQIFRKNKLRSHIAATYLRDMKMACQELARVLKPGGYAVVVVGNNYICGAPFRTAKYIANIMCSFGLRLRLHLVDDIKSRGLMIKRNKTANVITQESVFLFQK